MKPVHLLLTFLISTTLLTACKPGNSAVSQPEIPSKSITPIMEPSTAPLDEISTTAPILEANTRFEQCAQIETTPLGTLRLAWIEFGDLWLWDREVGEPYSLTDSGDLDEVRFTRDGSSVVFTRQKGDSSEIWLTNADGSATRLLTPDHILPGQIQIIDFSFDEVWLAFTHLLTENGGELWAARLDGSEAKRLVNHDDLMAMTAEPLADFATPAGVVWLPNTHSLIYDAHPGFENGGLYIYTQRQNWLVDADSGDQSVLFPLGQGGQVSISPDGTALALLTPESLRLMNIEAQDLHDADIDFFAVGFGEYYAYPPMIWALDSGSILVAQPAEDGYNQDGSVSIWRIPVDDTSPTLISEFSGFFPTFSFSQDRTKIAFMRVVTPSSNSRELHIATLDGSEHIIYETADLLDFLGWSPDLSFVYSTGENPWKIILGEPCNDPVLVKVGFYPDTITWIHSTHFLFEKLLDKNFELYLGSLGTHDPLILLLNLENFVDYDFIVLPET